MSSPRLSPQEQRARLASLRAAMLDEGPPANGHTLDDTPAAAPSIEIFDVPQMATPVPPPALEDLIEARLRELLSISLVVGPSSEQQLSDKALSTLVTALKVAQGFVEWRTPGGGTGPGSKLKEGGDDDV